MPVALGEVSSCSSIAGVRGGLNQSVRPSQSNGNKSPYFWERSQSERISTFNQKEEKVATFFCLRIAIKNT